jgi:hypothetical protein
MNQSPTPLTDEQHDDLYGDPFSPYPTRLCANCGGPCYGSSAVCSEECDTEFTAYLESACGVAS